MRTTDKDIEHIAIVGAGIAGCHAARNLAVDHDVTVLDRSGVATGATGLSAGIVAPTLFFSDLPDVARHANAFFEQFDGTHGFEFTRRDRIDIMTDEAVADGRAVVERLADEGFPVSFLEAEAATDRYPEFDFGGFAGAALYEDTGWIDPYTYATALQSAAESRGAEFRLDSEVNGIDVENGAVAGVETDVDRIDADAVVIAAGWRTRDLLPDGVDVPIRPYRTQVVVLEPDEPLTERFPIGRVKSEHLYFRPEHNGDLLIGGGHHPVKTPETVSRDVDESFRLEIADFIPNCIDGFDDAGFVNGWAGIDAASPDTRPIVDAPEDAPTGLVVATGFNGLGIMTSPVVGPTVRQRLTGAEAGFPTAPFAADQFEHIGTSFEYVSTSEV